jgi:hypothetical protein
MDKVKISYIVDVLILIAFIVVAVTGVIKWPGLGLHKLFDFGLMSFIHDWSGLIAVILAFIHVALSWKFMVCMTKKYFTKSDSDKVC